MGFEAQKEKLAAISGDLLSKKKVELILSFTSGGPEGNAVPFFMRSADEVAEMRWDDGCMPNLAVYLKEFGGREGKIALVAKPCDARAIAVYISEGRIERGNLYIIGIECGGMKKKDGSAAQGCENCGVRTPPVFDVLIREDGTTAEPVENGERIVEMPKKEKQEADKTGGAENPAGENGKQEEKEYNVSEYRENKDKAARFREELKKCIMCFACRQACFGCYCETCFIERGIPDWQPSNPDMGRKMMFHLGRFMHLAGRCVECGACERACPSGVNIRYIIKDIAGFCEELYGCKAGMEPAGVSALTAFDTDDPEVGFLEIGNKDSREEENSGCGLCGNSGTAIEI